MDELTVKKELKKTSQMKKIRNVVDEYGIKDLHQDILFTKYDI